MSLFPLLKQPLREFTGNESQQTDTQPMFTPISIIFTRIVYAYLHLFIIYAYYILFMMCSRSSQNFKPARTWPPVLKGHKKTYTFILANH